MFVEIFNDTLTLPDFDVHVGSAILSIASGKGLSISLVDVNVAGYTATSTEVVLTSSGASLSGALSSSTIALGDVEVHDASIQLAFWSSGKKKDADIMLSGSLGVDFLDPAIRATVHLYPNEDGVEWAVVAELHEPGKSFALSDAITDLKDTFLDLPLRNAVFIAVSKDGLPVNQLFPAYHVRKGERLFFLRVIVLITTMVIRCSHFRSN